MLSEMRAIVYGKVQGIGFRAKTKEYAEQLKLTGFVRNLSDGTVEICAQGEEDDLKELLQKLENAYKGKYLERMEISFRFPQARFEKFFVTIV